jgi:hypothetical protein
MHGSAQAKVTVRTCVAWGCLLQLCLDNALSEHNMRTHHAQRWMVYDMPCSAAVPSCVVLCCAALVVVPVSGTMREASSAGFRKIANFIFGKGQPIRQPV